MVGKDVPIARHPAMRDDQMTLPQAAKRLGLKPDSLRRQAGRGILRAYKLPGGRDWIVDLDEVERYRREHRRST